MNLIWVRMWMALSACLPAVVGVAEDEVAARRVEYAEVARQQQGDAQRGRLVFENGQRAACAKCHSTNGVRSGAGPDLSMVGDKFPREELIAAILEPSSRIAIGYGSTLVETDAGKVYAGVLQRVTDDWIEMVDEAGQVVRIPVDEIVEQQESEVSLMPAGLENVMTREEFCDVLAYLESLHQDLSGSATAGTTSEIPRCVRPLEFRSLFDANVHLEHPVWIGAVPGRKDCYVVLEQAGKAWLIEQEDKGNQQVPFVDLSDVVRVGGATGLLGMAFHPKFVENRKYYLKYQIVDGGRITTVVDEREFDADVRVDSGQSDAKSVPRRILEMTGVTQDHNGGCIEFGPDGYLYVGMGDTGPQRDPQGHGQDLGTLLGKILRIDVDRWDGNLPYAIPEDNPFRATAGARPEIWAYGFREPWRFSFDRLTRELWVGDVGQDQFEEAGIVRAGENHGWNVFEGFAPFSNSFRNGQSEFVPPVISYPRRLGVSVTGGYVYRGESAAQLQGWYIFGDFESRRIWALRQQDRKLAEVVEIGQGPTRVVSFAEDADGEILLVGYDAGQVYRLDLNEVDRTPLRTQELVATSEAGPVPWRFTLSPPQADWTAEGFDDSDWRRSPGGFGTQGTPGAIVRTDWRSQDIWLRREFELPMEKLDELQQLALRIHHDEDAEIFLNGVEVQRVGRWTSGYVELPLDGRAKAQLRAGKNLLAIHCRQQFGGQYIDAGLVEFVRP